ncbi:MAG TPA: cell wall hydrolase [Bauldia sp.]|nr:cell wall hydrolase [Bauldia sp.]
MLAGGIVGCSAGISAWSNVPPSGTDVATVSAGAGIVRVPAVSNAFDSLWNNDEAIAPAAAPRGVRMPVFFAWADTADGVEDRIAPIFASLPAGSSADVPSGEELNARETECLATAVYFEARGESPIGQLAVAEVILNRVKTPGFPKTICGVVYENAGARNGCQFSFACDGTPDRIRDRLAWRRSMAIAQKAMSTPRDEVLPDIGNATHYHATYASPVWAGRMKMVDVIGRHVFYAAAKG